MVEDKTYQKNAVTLLEIDEREMRGDDEMK